MQKQNRTDRIIILIALAILFIAGGAFYFDNWMWGSRRNRGESIGVLDYRSGDVRVKFEGDLKWSKAARGQDVVYNDSIYAGADSNAKLKLGNSEMEVSENTLVVLRRQDNVNFMNLSYGNLFGKVGKNEKVVIDTGSGKPIELNTTTGAQITVRKRGHRTELEVTSGRAEILVDGKRSQVTKESRLVVEDKGPAQVQQVGLQAVAPLTDQVIYSEDPVRIDFNWRWTDSRRPAATDTFTVEFSSSPQFTKLHAKRVVVGQLSTGLNVQDSLNLYYRVRGPQNQLSQVERVNFIRIAKPLIVRPLAQSLFVVPAGTAAMVPVEFRKPESASVWYQVASDSEFKNVVYNANTRELKAMRELPIGNYFLRAKSDFGNQHQTGWTESVPFAVEKKTEVLHLPSLADKNRVVIPNRSYPASLYAATSASVKTYLSKHGVMQEFFPFSTDGFDELQLKFENAADGPQILTQKNLAWPTEKLRPGNYTFAYQASKAGFDPTPWSEPKRLEITMEPPRPLGDVQYGVVDRNGLSDAQWAFTPLLFAKTYDVEISHDPNMRSATELKVSNPQVRTALTGENYWRVRARDAQGRVISEFSSIYKFQAPVPVYLAKNPPIERKPAATERTQTKVESTREDTFEKNGWWVWFGSGESYTNYSQSVPGLGTLNDQHTKGPSQSLEAGFVNSKGWGGIISMIQSPGEIHPENAAIDNGAYSWSTVSGEALYRKVSPFTVLGSPLVYGVRMGVQEHRLPFIYLTNSTNLFMKNNSLTTASAGILTEWSRRRWTYYWMMRYQYPLSTKADGAAAFSINPLFEFDGSIGTSYNFTHQLKAGIFWYGQWHQFSFKYSDGAVENIGNQSLFYSNIDLRLGYDF